MINARLGTWKFPSGNSVDVRAQCALGQMGHVWFEWDCPPPLSEGDYAYYMTVVRPTVLERVISLLEAGRYGEA